MRKLFAVLLVLAAIAGIAGASVSVGFVIYAVNFIEWGRVILYSFTTAVCVEMTVLAIGKLRSMKSA